LLHSRVTDSEIDRRWLLHWSQRQTQSKSI